MKLLVALVCLGTVLPPRPAAAQEPQSRAEVLASEREEKAADLEPASPGRLERWLLALENDRLFERVLNPAEGFYPKIGNITAGSGFAFGPGFRHPGVIGESVHFSAFAMGSVQKYWMVEGRLAAPELAGNRLFADVYARRYEFPEEDFFGLGPESRREDHSTYALRSTDIGFSGGVRPAPWLSIGSGLEYLTPRVTSFAPQPDFVRSQLSAEVNTRLPRGNPREGGRYAVSYQRFDARGDARGFDRVDVDLQQYISLYRHRRVLALRGFLSASEGHAGADVPFYYMRTLGGPDDLRGFRRFRFRDRNLLLLQAEYRWEIFTAVDGAIFYDAGAVAPRVQDLSLGDLESDYGIGFRFGTANGVFLRVEGAFGSSGGAHFILRFGHVF